MNAIERTRMFKELVLIRSRLLALGYKLIREGELRLWRIEKSKHERYLWLEWDRGSWSIRPIGSEQKHPVIWRTILEAIAKAN
ncbi:hypothetical protein BCD67_24835 [Oscillatoriales cyanobacterium USR001]|nr:hypothetical protein BCD67_24835 [Oscillatoriales cyanobacterium USR001]